MAAIAIVGAGLAGRLCAWRLAASGHQITLIDAHEKTAVGTGLIAAAMLAPYTEAVGTERLIREVGIAGLAQWPKWLAQLEQETGQIVYFHQPGTLVVAHAGDASEFKRFAQHAAHRVEPDDYQTLSRAALSLKSANLASRFDGALYFEHEAVLCNHSLYKALAQTLQQYGVEWCEQVAVTHLDGSAYITELDRQFDRVIDCRGLGAKPDMADLRGVRGELIRVHAPDVNLPYLVRLLHPRYPLYIAPKPDNEFVIGATQIESEHDSPMTVRSGLELLSALYSVDEAFAEASVLSCLAGNRPALPNNLPRLEVDNRLIRINGLHRHGYLLAPVLVEAAVAEALGAAGMPAESFGLGRVHEQLLKKKSHD